MTTEPTSEKRAALVAALRELADFYERNPDMPAPEFPEILVGLDAADDDEGRQGIQHAADLMGVEAKAPGTDGPGQKHYMGTGRFGPGKGLFPTLALRAYYIPQCERES